MEKFENKSSVENAIRFLNDSREYTNGRLAKKNLELVRNNDNTVLLKDKESNEIETFEIETLENAKHPRFDATYDLLAETFGSNELDTKDIMAEQMQGLICGYPIETGGKAVIFTISKNIESIDENNKTETNKEVVGTLDGGLINLQDETGKFTGECIFMVFYIASKTDEDPKKNYRQYGFGRELMISAYEYAKKEAQSRGMKLIGAAGECTYTSRTFWEKMDWKRTYVQNKDEQSKNWKEVGYVQPPLDFDLETGEVEEDAGEAPEHFMINLFNKNDNNNPNINEKLTSIINGFYRTNNYIPPEAFGLTKELQPIDSTADKKTVKKAIKAYAKHIKAVSPLLQDFKEQLNDMKVRFLTKAEIEAEKLSVEDYITGDDEAEMLAKANAESMEKMKNNDKF